MTPKVEPVRTGWMARAACREADPKLFFRAEYRWGLHPRDQARLDDALRFCARCPVRAECLDYAHDANVKMGVWGGRSFD